MTNWMPQDLSGDGPIYLRLADRIENAISTGALPTGTKLPPQRNLAFDLGVTIGTIGRAYALCRTRGLVSGEVGRGTFVLGQDKSATASSGQAHATSASLVGTRAQSVRENVLRLDSTAAPAVGQDVEIERALAAATKDFPQEITSYSRSLPQRWLEAGCRWLAAGDWRPELANVVPTLGAHPAILSAALAVTQPGDRIITEELSYCQVARALTLAGRRVVGAAMDGEGLVPEDLDRLCAQQHPKLLFVMPGMQNPTLGVISTQCRRAIVEIARQHNLWLVEDAIYGSLAGDPHESLAALAPERTFRIDSLSKSVAAGLRGGWMSCPPGLAARIHAAHKLMTGGLPFLLAETASRLVLDGMGDAIRQRVRADIATRVDIARASLADFDMASHSQAPYVWLAVPEPWQSGTLKKAAEREHILIDDEDEFKSGRSERAYHRVRIGLTVPHSHDALRHGLATLRSLLAGDALFDSYS